MPINNRPPHLVDQGFDFCSSCGDPVLPGRGCCHHCKGSSEIQMTPELEERIKKMYWKADLKPMRIFKLTGVHPATVREICYGKSNQSLV